MRRPLKPFVTEYKGSRRASALFNEPPAIENDRPAPKAVDMRPRMDADESSYEAAMRAADALFAAPQRTEQAVRSIQTAQVAEPSQQDLPQPDADGAGRLSSERNGGRILRAIEETLPPPQFAALEAEFAPKRRGRKPGSKNKPKAPAVAPHVVEAVATPDLTVVPQQIAISAQQVGAAPRPQVVALSEPQAAARGDKKYGWARDRLKPGESWKRRRLPRVCW